VLVVVLPEQGRAQARVRAREALNLREEPLRDREVPEAQAVPEVLVAELGEAISPRCSPTFQTKLWLI
jgi:hypothetical protein